MSNKNEVFEYLIDKLRQQVNNNQCEYLAQEVQSLKNQLRDASAQIKELHLALVKATGDVEAYKLIRKGEQSGCRKEDTQEWPYRFYYVATDGSAPFGTKVCKTCGVTKSSECKHDWVMADADDFQTCSKCGALA